MYKAEILADSINPQGDRITTMKVTFPRFILAEFNTHRMFSRNSASSRAIPFKKMVSMVEENPFTPLAWQKDHKGMQGTEYLEIKSNVFGPVNGWLEARNKAVELAKYLNDSNVTKQLCNRLLEPFMWHTVIVTATEWENFFKLRCPQYTDPWGNIYRSFTDALKNCKQRWFEGKSWIEHFTENNQSQADIHIQAIAELMWDVINESIPKQLKAGEWNIPFGDNIDLSHSSFDKYKHENKALTNEELINLQIKVSVARCARISYQTLGDSPKIDYEADLRLHDRLAESGHWSPFEHVTKAMSDEEYNSFFSGRTYVNQNESNYKELNKKYSENGKGWCRNFRGWISYRYMLEKYEN